MFWLKSQKWTREFLFIGSSSVWDHTQYCVRDTLTSCLGALVLMLQSILRRSSSLPQRLPSSARQCRTAWTGGGRVQAFILWQSVVVFEHYPPAPRVVGGPPEFPPLRQQACSVSMCPRCMGFRGGFVFPWIGTWTRRGTVVVPGSSAAGAAWYCADDLGPVGAQPLGIRWSGRGLCAGLFVGFSSAGCQNMIGRASGWHLVKRFSPTCVLGAHAQGPVEGPSFHLGSGE